MDRGAPCRTPPAGGRQKQIITRRHQGKLGAPLTSPLSNLRAREKRAAGRLRRHLPHRPPQQEKTRRLLSNRPCFGFVYEEPHPKGRLRVNNRIVPRLYNYAVNETVELRFLAVFQHVVDPTRVRTVADKNSAITPLDLRPTVAD